MPLRLKSLELHGYKTFAAQTAFEFAPGVTAIVGPNGSGKSNIADALRWVLGEQSYSLLRGKKTEDMIFSGSEHRPRAGMASAEVLFDNSDKWLPVDFSEVAITRRAYRDGHNDYLLNGQHVRLRDMNELLAAAGLSERTYTMVGQGLVDASLALNPDDRRRLFEEAAGVGLYRIRREEALKRLESTLRNAERVQDILAEIEPRLKTLERQARRAKEFAAAQSDLREVLREWYGYHWHRAQKELQQARELVRINQEKATEAREAYERTKASHGEIRSRLGDLRSQIADWHRQAAQQHEEREIVTRSLAVLEERRNTIEDRIASLTTEHQRSASDEVLASERLRELEKEIERTGTEAEEATAQLRQAQDALKTRQAGRGALEIDLEDARDRVAGLGAVRAEVQAKLDTFKAQADYQQSRMDAAQKALQQAAAGTKAAEDALKSMATKRQEREKLWKQALAKLESARRTAGEREGDLQATVAERANLVSAQSKLQAQLEVLEQAERMLTGYADGAQFLLGLGRQGRVKIRGAMSAILEIPAEFETAIAAALGDAVDSIVIDGSDVDAALGLLEQESGGRALLMSLDGRRAESLRHETGGDILGVASKLVRAPDELRNAVEALLGSTLIVRNKSIGRRIQQDLPPHGRAVTLSGEVFRGDGLIIAGKPPSAATLSRPRQKREIASSLTEMAERLPRVEARVATASTAHAAAQDVVRQGEGEAERLHREVLELQSQEHEAQLELERLKRLEDWHKNRLDETRAEKDATEAESLKLSATLAEQESITEAARLRIQKLTEQLSQLSLDEAQELAAYWTTRAAVAAQGLKAAELRRDEHLEAAQRLQELEKDLGARLASEQVALRELEAERAHLVERERELHSRISQLQEQIQPAEAELERRQREEVGMEDTEVESQRQTSSAERTLNQYEIDLVRRQEALETLRARIVDDFGLVSFEYAASVEGPVPLPFEGLVEELRSVSELAPDLEDQLNQRRARLRRLGLINPEAAKDYEAESERYSFMTAQVQDLRQAEADLRQVIAELDETTRKEFSRTFAAVDRQFREIFTRLFGGGSARLALTDPGNLIETGIEIEARLPGRREQGLSLLSGGERSLTAIALVFALLKVSPTPVCVLDEVDAMLDEANVGRFRDLLAELSQETQFIVITHNRNTVQAADYIYGVTMGRDSTSQVISLRLDEVSEEILGTARS